MLDFITSGQSERERREAAALFRGSSYGEPGSVTREGWEQFKRALETGKEEPIQRAICASPYLIQYVIRTSGHHGTWVFSKRAIRTQSADLTPGLVPDFLVATRSSLGYFWYLVELKLPTIQFANARGDGYSTDGHKGVAQCAAYLSHFSEYVETVRQNVGVTEIVQPKNAVLIIGDSTNETDSQLKCRRDFHGIDSRVEVATYDRIVRGVKNDNGAWFS